MSEWTDHVARWRDCTECPLCQQRSNIVLARGEVPCDVLFIGEAPGASEDATGRPFDGPAGRLLDQIIERAVPPTATYALTNLVCCYPRDAKLEGYNEPDHDEILACRPRLEEFVALARPRLVVCVGSLAWGYTHWVEVPRVQIVHPAHILARLPQAQKAMAVNKCIVTVCCAVEDVVG